jgi:hypothetical protein
VLPSRRQSARCRRLLAAAFVAAALPALSGCASNFGSPVLQPYNPSVGVDVRRDGVWGMNMLVVLPSSGGQGTLVGALLNQSGQTDRLVAAEVSAEPRQGSMSSTLVRPGAALEPGRLVEMSDPTTVAVQGDVTPGLMVDLTLQFQRSRAIHTQVPVVTPTGPYAQVPLPGGSSAEPSPTESPTESPTGSPTSTPTGSPGGAASESPSPARAQQTRSPGAGG